MSTWFSDLAQDFLICELCDAFCPRDICADCGENVCEYCLAEYGCEMAGNFPGHA